MPIVNNQSKPSVTPTITLPPIPSSKILPTNYHIFQTFNNCGPAAFSMALRFYGINVTQEDLGKALRPYQVAGGDNVLVPKEKEGLAQQILGENLDSKIAWKNAVKNSQEELTINPDDIYAKFNLSVALFNTGDFKRSVNEFEKVENLLPFRTLWYQIEPIEAYFELGNYEKVLQISERVLNNQNRAFSEAYILRGKSYKSQDQNGLAKQEFEKAVFYNSNLKEAQDLLNSL